MERVLIINSIVGVCHMQVCVVADATDEEILKVCNKENPSGTTQGWTEVIRKRPNEPNKEPVQCKSFPERLHLLLVC